MKVALVGIGYWGSKVLRNLVAAVGSRDVVAVDERPEALARVGDLFPGIRVKESLAAALGDDTVGSVIVATPVSTHADLARQTLRADRHCLVEKPLTSSVAEAEELAALASERKLVLMCGHTFVFSPRVEVLAGAIDSGQIGKVHYAISSRLNLGIHRPDVNVIWDLASHDFSIVLHLLQEVPVLVQSTAQSMARNGMPDVAFVNLTFPSGAVASVLVSWLAPRKVRNTVVVGEHGMIVYDDTEPDEPVKIYDRGVVIPDSASFGENQLTYRYGDTIAPYVSPEEPLRRQLDHFLECAETGKAGLSGGWFALDVVRVLDAADRSWRLGGIPVRIEPRSGP